MAKASNKRVADALAAMTGVSPAQPPPADPYAEPESTSAPPQATVDAPPPPSSAFAVKHSTASLRLEQSLRQKRTLIPILLTLGVLLPVVGSLKWLMPDTPFGGFSLALVVGLIAAGLCLLVVALLNMLQVRDVMPQIAKPADTASRHAV